MTTVSETAESGSPTIDRLPPGTAVEAARTVAADQG
eukprot:gene32833-43893_t